MHTFYGTLYTQRKSYLVHVEEAPRPPLDGLGCFHSRSHVDISHRRTVQAPLSCGRESCSYLEVQLPYKTICTLIEKFPQGTKSLDETLLTLAMIMQAQAQPSPSLSAVRYQSPAQLHLDTMPPRHGLLRSLVALGRHPLYGSLFVTTICYYRCLAADNQNGKLCWSREAKLLTYHALSVRSIIVTLHFKRYIMMFPSSINPKDIASAHNVLKRSIPSTKSRKFRSSNHHLDSCAHNGRFIHAVCEGTW